MLILFGILLSAVLTSRTGIPTVPRALAACAALVAVVEFPLDGILALAALLGDPVSGPQFDEMVRRKFFIANVALGALVVAPWVLIENIVLIVRTCPKSTPVRSPMSRYLYVGRLLVLAAPFSVQWIFATDASHYAKRWPDFVMSLLPILLPLTVAAAIALVWAKTDWDSRQLREPA